ncbi:MAG: sulfite exporter TauE/SafE family protein [Deltaproteobacteria bacterium]|nr:sulfite exporter TauE/SafE family protein [Deltaproteobacteria bacterium]
MENLLFFSLIGLGVGCFGTLIGAGGGFILMPLLIFLHPGLASSEITAISLAIICINSLSGSISYARKKRIDYKSGALFALFSIPGAVLGTLTTSFFSREIFDPVFSGTLIMIGFYLFFKPLNPQRMLNEKNETTHNISYNRNLGLFISLGVGYFSSLLGIGGGIIHVPALVRFLNFPVHIATATSHFILFCVTLIATLVHWTQGNLAQGFHQVLLLSPGVIIGAHIGAILSTYVKGHWIIRALSLAIILVGLRLIFF